LCFTAETSLCNNVSPFVKSVFKYVKIQNLGIMSKLVLLAFLIVTLVFSYQ
jgi:hypothetical protein